LKFHAKSHQCLELGYVAMPWQALCR